MTRIGANKKQHPLSVLFVPIPNGSFGLFLSTLQFSACFVLRGFALKLHVARMNNQKMATP